MRNSAYDKREKKISTEVKKKAEICSLNPDLLMSWNISKATENFITP